MRALSVVRRTILAIWIGLIALVIAAAGVSRVAPLLGEHPVIIRGASMNPTLALGALVLEERLPADSLRPGDIVTFTTSSGVVITHRIVRLVPSDGTPQVETRGDANAEADAELRPVSAITGVVRFSVPLAGFLLAFMTAPTGILSVISMLGSLLALLWLVEDLEDDLRQDGPAPAQVPHGLAA